jgi:DNA-binding NtrC family response regulator
MVNGGAFRDDLYFRLAQTRIAVPSLVERREDIGVLAAEFLRRLPKTAACARAVSQDALDLLGAREWPGNVRELKNAIERAAYMASGSVVRPEDLVFEPRVESKPTSARPPPPAPSEIPEFKVAKRVVVDEFERDYLERLMAKTNNNIAMAAGLAGVERHHLRTLLKKHGMHTRD